MNKVLVTGSTGFTGSYVLPVLLEQGYEVQCFVRTTSDTLILAGYKVEWLYGELADKASLERAMRGCDVLLNVASIGFGHAPGIVQAAEQAGITRAVFVSTTAIFTSLKASSKAVRMAAEECIRHSSLSYTILRPTMIYGSSRDRNMCRLIRYLQRWPIIPVFGPGSYLQQPVYVGDVAQALVSALSTDQTERKAYNISGAHALTYNDVIDTVCQLLNRKVQKIHLLVSPVVRILQFIEKCGMSAPIKAEQILRLHEDKAFDFRDAHNDFGYSPRSFAEGISLELKEMGLTQ